MGPRRLVVVLVIACSAVITGAAPHAGAHRSGCHAKHVCPSDHATYKWKGRLCVKPTSDKRTPAFRKKVRHQGLTYYCR